MVLVPELGALVLALFCLALAVAATIIVKALIDSMGGVPVIGKVIAAILNPVVHALSWAAGQLEHGVDAILGATFSTLSKVLEWTFDLYKEQAAALLQIAHLVGGQLYHLTGLNSLVHRLEKVWHGIEHGIKTLTREYHGIDRRVHKLERELARGIGHDLRIQVAGLEKEVGHLEHKVIPAIESGVTAGEQDVSQLAKYIADNFVSNAELATEATAAAILAVAGLSWLRCNSNPFNNNKNACGLWGTLANLLALAVLDLAALASLYELIGKAQKVTPTVAGIASDLLKV